MPSSDRLFTVILSMVVLCSGCQGDPAGDSKDLQQADDSQGPSEFSSWAGEERIATNDVGKLFTAALKNYEQGKKAGAPEARASKLLLAAAQARRIASLDPDFLASQKEVFSTMYYSGACALSVQGKPKLAMAALDDALAIGFHDLDLLMLEEDLENVRQLPEFGDQMESWAVLATTSLREKIANILSLNQPFAFDFELTSFDGTALKLADMKGKVVVVYLWGTWSKSSRDSLPTLIGLQQEYAGKIQLVGINFNEPGGPEAVTSFLAEKELTVSAAMGNDELLKQVPEFEAFPTTVFIDRRGTARLKLTGGHSYKFVQAIVAVLSEEEAK